MKVGSGDKKVSIEFNIKEFEMLQDNAYLMADAFGLDSRILRLKGKRPIGFYQWDLECLNDVIESVKDEINDNKTYETLLSKIRNGLIEVRPEIYKSSNWE